MLKKFLFILIAWVIVIFIIEFTCSLIVQNRYIALDPVSADISNSTLGYFAPNQNKILLFPGLKPYHAKTTALGLRTVGKDDDLNLAGLSSRKKILGLGDSISFGLFVNDEDSYPYRLQKLVSRDTVVLNAGAGSSTIADYLYYLKIKGLALKPDLVVINFCDNDLTELNKWTAPLYEQLKEKSVLSFSEKFKRSAFLRSFREMELKRRYVRSTKKIRDERTRNILFTESKNVDDILYTVESGNDLVLRDPHSPELKKQWENYFKSLDEAVALLRKDKIRFVILIYPHIYTVFEKGKGSYQEVLIDHFKKESIPYVDLTPEFKKHKKDILALYNNLPRDFHLSGEGNQLLAEKVLEFYQK